MGTQTEKQAAAEAAESTEREELSGAVVGNLSQIVAVGLLTVMTLWLCGALVLFALFASVNLFLSPNQASTLRDWVQRTSSTASDSLRVMIASTAIFAVFAAATAVAASFRTAPGSPRGAELCAVVLGDSVQRFRGAARSEQCDRQDLREAGAGEILCAGRGQC